MLHRSKRAALLGCSLLMTAVVLLGSLPAWSQSQWAVTNTFNVGGDGGWDYVTVDAKTNRLYVTRSTHTMVIDAKTGKTLADIPGQKRSHGVALVPKVNRGFISDGGGSGAIEIFNLKTDAVLGTIPAMPDADGIIYDPATNQVLAVSGDGGALMIVDPNVDPEHGKIAATIDLGGKPEFLAADSAGKAYINLEDKDLVAVVDLKARKVIARWPVAPGGSPVGMSMDQKDRVLFIGCRKPQKMIVMSADTGKVLADFDIGAGVDATKFDGAQAFASCRDGHLFVFNRTAPGKYELAQTVATADGARTMTVDPQTRTIYLPTADMEPAQPGKRPAAKPGSFKIVVVSQKK
ncbi:MAG: YncE family protein [Terriglobales bacterium]